MHHANTRGVDKNTVFLVVDSRSILYFSNIVYLQVDWFSGYNWIMIEHYSVKGDKNH